MLDLLDSFENEALPHNKPFRMPVQDVYKFTKGGDDRRIIAGTAVSGELMLVMRSSFIPQVKNRELSQLKDLMRIDSIS